MWLLPAVGDADHVPTIASLAGAWQIQQPDGKAVCSVTLSSDTDQDGTPKMSLGGDYPPTSAISSFPSGLWRVSAWS